MSWLRKRQTPRYGALLAMLVLLAVMAAPGWAASDKALADLAGPLRALALSAAQSGVFGNAFPLQKTVGGDVVVVIQCQSPSAAASVSLAPYGGHSLIRRDSRIQALVPASRLSEIAGLPQVAQIRAPFRPVPMQGFGATSSEGVQLTGAIPYHVSGIYGQGVDVAIIDIGFDGWDTAEIPAPNTVSFAVGGVMTGDVHGTACAEIVADMADGASFTLINVDTNMALEMAAEYVRNQNFDVASVSLGAFGGPYNGTHTLSQEVNRARNSGVFWVNSAGNEAQHHYQGDWADHNGNGLNEFNGGDETVDVYLFPGQFQCYLSWWETTPTGLTDRDYDLVLVDAGGNEVARSGFTQNGDDTPVDVLLAYIATEGTYGVEIEYFSGPAIHADRFQLFSPSVDLEGPHQEAASSLVIPAEASGAYAVGATRGALTVGSPFGDLPVDTLEPFSSQGPAIGHPELVKPDLVGPDGVLTSIAGYDPFYGTSAAAPHVAGAACLILAEDLLRSAEEVEKILNMQALPLGVPTPNDEFGNGRLRIRVGADSRAPSITIAYPQNSTTITTRTPTVTAYLNDDGSGLDPTSIVVELNGVEVLNGSTPGLDITLYYDAGSGRLQWQVPSPLARTNHMVAIRCADNAGNVADDAITNFRVSAPTIAAGTRIVSFPYHSLANIDPAIILGTPLSQMALVRWYEPDLSNDKYHFYPDARASLEPGDCQQANLSDRTVPYPPAGLGYFLNLPNQAVLEIQGSSVQEFPSTHVRLFYGQQAPRGWNLIGNPYEEQTSWGAAQFVTNGVAQDLPEAIASGVTEGVLFDYIAPSGGQPGFYDFATEPTSAVMDAQTGYWIHVNEETRVVFYSSAVASAQDSRVASASAADKDGWLLRLAASAGEYQDPTNYIGVASTASAGYDAGHDVPEPPQIVSGLQMAMNHAGWGENAGMYAKDVRAAGGAGTWEVEVSCALADATVTVSWPGLNAEVPQDVKLILVDNETGRQAYMRTSSRYQFNSGPDGGVRHLTIRAENASSQVLALSGVTAQSVGGGAAISYTLSTSAEVTVEVRNIAGRLVRAFAPRQAESGVQQTTVWNGISNYGGAVPSGRYLVRLTARADTGQTVQAIRPFNVAR